MFLMRADPLRGQVGGGWALEIESFLSPVKWHGAERREPFGAQKHEISRAQQVLRLENFLLGIRIGKVVRKLTYYTGGPPAFDSRPGRLLVVPTSRKSGHFKVKRDRLKM
jgi:hypothetical protein